ncbi:MULTISPECIES: autotransporter-associated beta strand repeat-containing protein [Candidatus Rhabdochlamydia]|nr:MULTISPECIES: autotransporter-associated beta strand repeat-containing protein [Rhabdochlamydia]
MKTLLLLACHVLILSSRAIWSSDFRVTNNADSGTGSFRQSIIDLNALGSSQPSTVTFEPGLGRIQLFSDLPAIEVEGEFTTSTRDSLVIDGSKNQYLIFSALSKPFKVNVAPSSSLTLSGILDSGSLIRSGKGELILEGSNRYTGGTVIIGGLLALSGSGSLAPNGKVVISSGGILNISAIESDSQTISDLSGSGGEIVLGAKTLIMEERLPTEYGGVISGTGSIVKQGLAKLTLTESNTYTGRTTIDTGILALSGSGSLAPTSKVITHAGAIFDISSIAASSQAIGSLSGSGGEIVLGEKTLIIGGMLSTVYRGVISGTGSVVKQGPQMFILMGENTYTGGTIISGGVLQGNTTSLQGDIVNDSSLIFDQMSLGEYAGVISGSGILTKQNMGLLILSNANTYTGGTIVSGGVLQGNTISLQGDIVNDSSLIFDQMSLGEYAGVISGTGAVIKKNVGTLILSNANTYTGGTTVIEGSLQGNTTSLQGDIVNDALVVFDQVGTGTYNGMLAGTGTVIKQNTGTLILKGSNHTGSTRIKAGRLALSGRLLSMGSVDIHAGVFDISSISATSQTIRNLSGIGGEVVLGTKTLIAGSLDDTIYEGVISGAGSFTKQGLGTLTFSGIHTYTGATNISSGRIALSGNGSLAIDNLVILSGSDSIFDITEANGARSIGSIDGVEGSQVLLGANALTVGDSNQTTYAGIISGTGAFIKQGSGRLILTGPNTYSGGTLVSAGFLQGSTNSLQGNILNNASIVFDQAHTGTYDGVLSGDGALNKQNTGTVIFTGANTYSGGTMITLGTLALSGLGTILPTGTVIINVGNFDISDITASSQTIGELIGGGTIFLGEKTLITATKNNTSYVGIINGTGSFIKQGSGVLTLSGTNTYSGGTTINAGTLALSGSGKLSSTGSVTIHAGGFDISNIADSFQNIGDLSGSGGEIILGDKTLIQEAFNHTSYAGLIRGSGALIKQGLGTLVLTGDNDYSGGTTVNDGVLQGNTNSLQGNILNNASLVFDQAHTGTYNGVLSGAGSIDKRDTGTVIFTGTNTYSGGTMINAGTLALSGSGKLSSIGAVTINEGAFDISGIAAESQPIGDLTGVGFVNLGNKNLIEGTANHTTYSGVIQGGANGRFTKQGSGILTLTGINTYSGGTIINEGTLALVGSGTLNPAGDVIVNAGVFHISDITAASQTIGSLSGTGGIVELGTKNLIEGTVNDSTYSGVIQGSGSLIKQNTGTLTLTGVNTYSGGTIINGGTLALSALGALHSAGNVTINEGVFDISDITAEFHTIGDLTGAGSVNLGSKILITGASSVDLGSKMLSKGIANHTIYHGVIHGEDDGVFIKQGIGTLKLTGSSIHTGHTLVAEGILHIHGKLRSTVNVLPNASLMGNGTVGHLINMGDVSPGESIGTIEITGDFKQSTGGRLSIEIAPDGATDLLQITETATLDGALRVIPEAGVYLEGTTYTFLSAGSVTGQFSSTFSTRRLDYAINYFPTQAQLLILASSLIIPARPDGNAGAVVDYLFCSSFDFANLDLDAVAKALLILPADQYAQALNRLTPSQFGAFALNELENNFSLANTFFVTGANQRSCCYATCESTNIWINPLGLVYSQKNRLQLGQEAIGFTNHTYGIAAGIDHLLSNDWTLGFGLGYSYSHLHWKHQAGKARADSGYLGPYIGYDCGSFYFGLLVLGAGNFYDVDRKIVFPGISRVASSHPNTWDLSEVILAGFKLEPFYHFFVQPEFLLDQLNIFQERFQESGAGSIDLAVKRKHTSFLRSLVNLKFTKEWVCCNMCLASSVNVGWLRTTPLTGRHYTASFRKETFCSPNFSVTSFNQVIDQALVGGQLLLSSQGGFSVFLGYDGRFGNGSKVNEINLALDWRF